jgi:hypothetical protein
MNPRQDSCVRDMPAVPRQQVFYAMMGHAGDVQGIDGSDMMGCVLSHS